MWDFNPAAVRKVERLSAVAEEAGLTRAQLALAWCLRPPAVSSAIVGATRPEQLDEAAGACGARLTGGVLKAVDEANAGSPVG